MGMAIEDIKHCLKVMVDCEVCEECNLYGMTGTDHCEHDCVYGALDIIDKYQKIQEILRWNNAPSPYYKPDEQLFREICEVLEDGNDNG